MSESQVLYKQIVENHIWSHY